MLTPVADGVLVRQSLFCRTNTVVVRGEHGVLLVDPGVTGADLTGLAVDLDTLGAPVRAGFCTHPHFDHLLWHPRFGAAPRYATVRCAATALARRPRLRRSAARDAPGAPLDLLGLLTPLPAGAGRLAWDGPEAGIVEHCAHAPGHVALVLAGAGVLLAGDMLSDVEIPLLDPETADPYGDYCSALDLLERAIGRGISTVVPGHGSVARGPEIRARLDADRRYLSTLRGPADPAGRAEPADPRLGPGATYGTDWLPGEHRRNQALARR